MYCVKKTKGKTKGEKHRENKAKTMGKTKGIGNSETSSDGEEQQDYEKR